MYKPEKVILSNMCMIYKDNQILIQERVNPTWPGVAFPGGHIELGESVVDSTIREVLEETGLKISNLILCGIKQWFEKDVRHICFLYKTTHFEGQLISTREGKNSWIDRKNLHSYVLATNFEDMIQVFENENISEQFRIFQNGEKISILK